MTRPRIALLLALSLVAAGAGLFVAWNRGLWRPVTPDTARFPLLGVDVSRHQGDIAWGRVAADPRLAFAYVKATEGGDWVDPTFEQNWREARNAGLHVGAYHFLTFCRSATEQARHFLSVVRPEAGMLPPALDVEFGGNCSRKPTAGEVRESVRTWLQLVESALGQRPIVYVTPEAFDAFFAEAPLPHALWFRDLLHEPALPEGHAWSFWQFANRARVDGVSGPVDLNAFAGTREMLASIALPVAPTPAR